MNELTLNETNTMNILKGSLKIRHMEGKLCSTYLEESSILTF